MSENVTITLSELHCVAQSEPGGCEPYLFTSFFAIGADGSVKVTSPKHNDVRAAFADDVEAGMTLPVPQEIGTCELPAGGRVGVIALVLDEDLGRQVAVDKAHEAFHAEVDAQLCEAQHQFDPEALLSKVRGAVSQTFDYSDLHRDQDDLLGVGIYEVSETGPFEMTLGFSEDVFILRGEAR